MIINFFLMRFRPLVTGICLMISSIVQSQLTVQQAIDTFAADPVFAHASIGFMVIDTSTGDTLAVKNPAVSLSPASTVKLFTTATAFQVLGKDYAPKTRIYLDGTLGADSVLRGNLWIRGGGDVALGSRYYNGDGLEDSFLQLWADTLIKMGIRKIEGSIVADASEFGYQGVPDGWNWADMGNYYGAGPSGLVIYDNTLKYVFKTGATYGSKTTLLETIPRVPGMNFHNYITSGGSGDNSYIYGAPFCLDRFGTGTLGARANRFVVKGSMPDPELQFALEFRRVLELKGVSVRDSVKTARQFPPQSTSTRYPSMNLFYEHKGKPVSSIGWWTNMKSVNLFAEELLCWIGYAANGNGSTENGLDKLESYWTGKIPVSGMFLKDGSGLSRSNAVSAQHFCDLLRFMATSKQFDAFYGTLPVAGVSGTLSSVCKNQPGEGRVHAKSGTMKRIKSYAGYVETKGGKRLAFALIVNNFNCSSDAVVDRMEKVFNTMVLSY